MAGTIRGMGEQMTLEVQEMTTRFQWMLAPVSVKLSSIDYFLFGSDYENDLAEFGDLQDQIEDLKKQLAQYKKLTERPNDPSID